MPGHMAKIMRAIFRMKNMLPSFETMSESFLRCSRDRAAPHHTFKGRPFYTSHVEYVLKSEGYTGTWWYNKSDAKERVMRPREEWIAIPVPQLVTPDDFQRTRV